MTLLRSGGQETSNVAFDGVHAHGGTRLHERALSRGGLGLKLLEGLPTQVGFQLRHVLERAHLAERGALPHLLQIHNASRDAQRALGLRIAGAGRQQFVCAVDHTRGVERLADLNDGRVRELRTGA